MAAVSPSLTLARRLVVKIGSALLVDERGLRGDWLRALGIERLIMISGNSSHRVREAPVSRGRIYAYVMPTN